MVKQFSCFLKRDFIIHSISFFVFLFSTCFLIQSTKISIVLSIFISIMCFATAVCSIVFQLLFYKRHKEIPKNLRTVVLFYLMIISGIIITITILIINNFTYSFTRTTWVSVVMIVSLSTTTFAINYI